MIFVLELDEKQNIGLSDYDILLSEERKKKMERYKQEKDRYLCLYSFLLLRYGLYLEYKKIDLPDIDSEKKPRIRDSQVCFNISHCNKAVACVIDSEEVGIDVQDYNESVYDVRSMYLTKQEEVMFERSACSKKELTRIWTIKEAYGKFHGYGLCYSLCETSFDKIIDFDSWQSYLSLKMYSKKYECYAMSVCSKKELPLKYVSMQDLYDFAEFLKEKTLSSEVN